MGLYENGKHLEMVGTAAYEVEETDEWSFMHCDHCDACARAIAIAGKRMEGNEAIAKFLGCSGCGEWA